jgi:RND family efflux transporter MFP subunit
MSVRPPSSGLRAPLALILLAALPTLAACRERAHASRTEPPARSVEHEAALRPSQEAGTGIGVLTHARDARVRSRIAGRLTALPRRAGERVRAGEVIAEIAAEVLPIRVGRARSELRLARARLARHRVEITRAAGALGRGERLRDAIAPAALEALRLDLEDARAGARVARAEVAIASSALAEARTEASQVALHAPFDGVVAEVLASLGDGVESGATVVRVIDPGSLVARLAIAPAVAARWAPGDRVPLAVEGGGTIEAVVESISPEIDPTTGLRSVEARPLPPATREGDPDRDPDGGAPAGTIVRVGMDR